MRRIAVSLIAVMTGAMGAAAQDSLPTQLNACLAIPGMLQRLACYDRVAHGVSPAPLPRTVPAQRPVASAAPPMVGVPVAPVAPPTGLGSERLARPATARPQQLLAGVASVRFDPRGRFTITLDNGQVWRQLEGDTGVLAGAKVSAVRISRGALGSYDLNVVGRNATYRVQRLE